jgi:hypothetical protein
MISGSPKFREGTSAVLISTDGRLLCLVKTTGDGVLLEFPSVVDAVECAVAVQAVMVERNEGVPADRQMLFRIRINLGDILIDGDDSGFRGGYARVRDVRVGHVGAVGVGYHPYVARGAWYRGAPVAAAAVGGAALGAAAAGAAAASAYPYCGYPPYPPCY